MTHHFQYEVKINGKPRTLLVRYQIRDGKPELLRHCTCLDTGNLYRIDNWYSRLYTEALNKMEVAA